MDTTSLLLNTLLAMLLGAAVGLKSEYQRDGTTDTKIIGGFRTHATLALLGVISGALLLSGQQVFAIVISTALFFMILSYYVSGLIHKNIVGIGDEMSAIFAHLIGILVILQPFPLKFLIALTVLVVFIANRKHEFHGVKNYVSKEETIEYTLFAIVALVILPFLPNHSYSLAEMGSIGTLLGTLDIAHIDQLVALEIINPFKTWFIVVFVSGLDLFGHVLSKFISGEKSTFWSATIGGFVSSTSTTISLAIQSKTEHTKAAVNNLVAAALSANAASFIQILILVAPVSFAFLGKIFVPTAILAIGMFAIAYSMHGVSQETEPAVRIDADKRDKDIFKLEPALKFALVLTLVKLFTKLALVYLGDSGFLASSLLASVAGMDAIIINISQLVNSAEIALSLGYVTYMGANAVNLATKVIYSYSTGNASFAGKLALRMGIVFTLALLAGLII